MKKALISPLEKRDNGVRVAQIEELEFDVAAPLFWVECSYDITTQHTYLDGIFIDPVVEKVEEFTFLDLEGN